MSGGTTTESRVDPRLGCSTISFRGLPLPRALAQIRVQGFGATDLGALPGVCDHVPTPLPASLVDTIAEQVTSSGVTARVINADVGDLDDPRIGLLEHARQPLPS